MVLNYWKKKLIQIKDKNPRAMFNASSDASVSKLKLVIQKGNDKVMIRIQKSGIEE